MCSGVSIHVWGWLLHYKQESTFQTSPLSLRFEELNLSDNHVGDEGASGFAVKQGEHIAFEANRLDPVDLFSWESKVDFLLK